MRPLPSLLHGPGNQVVHLLLPPPPIPISEAIGVKERGGGRYYTAEGDRLICHWNVDL